jgi:hypothetical protein
MTPLTQPMRTPSLTSQPPEEDQSGTSAHDTEDVTGRRWRMRRRGCVRGGNAAAGAMTCGVDATRTYVVTVALGGGGGGGGVGAWRGGGGDGKEGGCGGRSC